MIEEIRKIQSGRKELRRFGAVMGLVLGVIGLVLFNSGSDFYPLFVSASIAFVALGILLPSFLLPVHFAWMALAVVLGWFMSRLILVALFYAVVTPTGFLARRASRDFSKFGFRENTASYWIPRKREPFRKERYETQY